MKQSILMFAIIALITSCKSSASVAPIILKDSVSITYKQGTVQPLSIYKTEEQPSPLGLRGAQTAFRRNSSAPALGKVGLGATREASVSEEALSERTNKQAVPPSPTIRVDTVFVERWHTAEVPSPPEPIPRFYKDCTWGFFILVLLILGRIALRITKAIYLRR